MGRGLVACASGLGCTSTRSMAVHQVTGKDSRPECQRDQYEQEPARTAVHRAARNDQHGCVEKGHHPEEKARAALDVPERPTKGNAEDGEIAFGHAWLPGC